MAKQHITCPCDEEFEAEIPETFNISENPQLLSSFREGEFLLVQCPRCGMEIETLFPFTITGLAQVSSINAPFNTIRFLPDHDRNRFLSGKITVDEERVVFGRRELIEKVTILEEHYDDRIVELIKFLLLEKVERKDAETEEEIGIIFSGDDDSGSLIFHISGLRPDETAIVKTPETLYKKAEEDLGERLKENPFREILKAPYISINKIDLEV